MDWERVAGPIAAQGHTPWIADIRTPILATLETIELGLRESLEGMWTRARQAPQFHIQEIQGADHLYTGQEHELAGAVLDWLGQLPAA